MHPIRFDDSTSDGVRLFHYLPGDDRAVTRHWPGLCQHWPEEETPFTEWAVNNCNTEEVAVYTGLAWRLTAGLDRYAIPTYYRDEAEHLLKQKPVMVSWEYEVDATAPTAAARNKGSVPGRTAKPFGAEPDDARRAGLFRLSTPRDLVSALQAVIFDAWSETTVFAVAPGPERLQRLVSALSGPTPPTLADVLEEEGVLVDLTIGSDFDYYNSITVASRADLRHRINDLTADCARRISVYEQRAGDLASVPDFLRAMPELAGVDLDIP
ncbi:hypothetical protein [Streptomyces sp. TLI_171]|uniref:hypothetical protein n=1 Tax=Streptomyces sp. TLI_171 TaxID=1938859 RepID=UPI000C173DDF|nr:hypothetical protein [Streptomyces sp. TLI_171]RKE02895.1 hypothetical protein BX266_7497 [Streptomyces sp. TLI_171]